MKNVIVRMSIILSDPSVLKKNQVQECFSKMQLKGHFTYNRSELYHFVPVISVVDLPRLLPSLLH